MSSSRSSSSSSSSPSSPSPTSRRSRRGAPRPTRPENIRIKVLLTFCAKLVLSSPRSRSLRSRPLLHSHATLPGPRPRRRWNRFAVVSTESPLVLASNDLSFPPEETRTLYHHDLSIIGIGSQRGPCSRPLPWTTRTLLPCLPARRRPCPRPCSPRLDFPRRPAHRRPFPSPCSPRLQTPIP
jgi:hypothetical protein